jgi:DNA-binding transcriptional LysR family regulator
MNLKTVDLNLLVSFDALVSERNVSRAAEKLGVTQSALSHALRRLRVTFGDPLLERGPRGMELTERALSLRQPVKAVLAEIQSIMSASKGFDPASNRRTFRLSMSDAMSIEALPAIVRRLRREAPHVDLRVMTSGPREAALRIVEDEIDLAIGVFPDLPPDVQDQELYRDKLICVADQKHPLLKRGRMDENAYFSCPHVTVASSLDPGVQLDDILAAMGVVRRVVATVPHYLAVPALIRGTDLIANTRTRLVQLLRNSAGLSVFPIPVPIRIPDLLFRQIWHRRYDRDAGHRWLRNLVAEAVRA